MDNVEGYKMGLVGDIYSKTHWPFCTRQSAPTAKLGSPQWPAPSSVH